MLVFVTLQHSCEESWETISGLSTWREIFSPHFRDWRKYTVGEQFLSVLCSYAPETALAKDSLTGGDSG